MVIVGPERLPGQPHPLWTARTPPDETAIGPRYPADEPGGGSNSTGTDLVLEQHRRVALVDLVGSAYAGSGRAGHNDGGSG